MLPRSLATRLVLASLAAVVAATLAGALVMSAFLWPSSERLMRAELDEEVVHIREGLSLDAAGNAVLALQAQSATSYDAMLKDCAYLVTDARGRAVSQSPEGPALDAIRGMAPSDRTLRVANGDTDIRLQVVEDTVALGGARYRVRVARSDRLVTTLDDYASELYVRAGTVAVLLALAIFALVTYLVVKRMVRPLRQASAVAARVGPRNLGARLRSGKLPSEVTPLIDAFNAALARLENGFRVQQEFLAAAAHELKTPLALLQAEIELGGAADKALLLRDTALMARQVHQLLHLAEASEGHNYSFEPTSLQTIARDAVHYLARLATRRGVTVAVDAPGDDAGPVEADGSAVFVLVKNLLENAIHHAPPDSTVRLVVDREGFSVEDQGPGIREADRPNLFKRFWRGDPRNGEGAGLGLSICMEICLAHGWRIVLDPPRAGTGARFVVRTREADAR